MNANSRFTVNGRNVSESEYVKDNLFTCYMLHSGLREDDVEEIDIDGGAGNAQVLGDGVDGAAHFEEATRLELPQQGAALVRF